MNPALARLILTSDRTSRRRLAGIAAGTMLGVALVLMLISAYQAFGARSLRSTWVQLEAGRQQKLTPDTVLDTAHVGAVTTTEVHAGQMIWVLKVAATPGSTVRIPGVPRIPAAGEYVASPALAKRIASVPADELGQRYGTPIGTIDPGAVEGPDSLVVVVGATIPSIVNTQGEAQIRTDFVGYEYASTAYRVVAVIGAFAVLIPVLLLIGIVTDLGSAQRGERFATLRLIGATPSWVARLSALETGVVSGIGSVLGIGLYLATIPLAARLRVGSSTFYPGDLVCGPPVVIGCVVVTTLAATVVAWWRTRRADIGPLGASRERLETAPRWVSLLALLIGLALLGVAPHLKITRWPLLPATLVISGFLLTMIGIVMVGPLLTWWTARCGVSQARSAAAVMGLSRVIRHPRSCFRTVAGLVIGLYAITVFVVAMTAAAGVPQIRQGPDFLPVSTVVASLTEDPEPVLQRLGHTPGVTATVTAHQSGNGIVMTRAGAAAMGVSRLPDTEYVCLSIAWLSNEPANPQPTEAPRTPANLLFAATDADPHSLERVKTVLLTDPSTETTFLRTDRSEISAHAPENQFAAMAVVGVLIACGVSAVSMTVSGISDVLAGRRVYGLLRLAGMPAATLRRTIAYQTLAPFLTVVTASIGLGVFSAWAVVTGVSRRQIGWPDPVYLSVLAGCAVMILVAVLAITRAGIRMVGTTTRFE